MNQQSKNNLTEKCGVIAVVNGSDAVQSCLIGLHTLQHRGHEAFGVAFYSDSKVTNLHRSGTVASQMHSIDQSDARIAIGHVRYSTSGGSNFCQPIYTKCSFGEVALAHNGNLINFREIQQQLQASGCVFQSDVDSEVIVHLIALSKRASLLDKIKDALQQIKGAYSLVFLINDKVFAARDPHGIRPLNLGKIGETIIIASETCALDVLGAKYVRSIEPGEILEIKDHGLVSHYFSKKQKKSLCIFEYIYFSRADSILENLSIYQVRKAIGQQLAHESYVESDMVVPIMDSGTISALGYSEESNIPIELAITKSGYAGRSFIEPTQERRALKVKLKHNANIAVLKSKNITLIDDSIVRGTTLKQIIEIMWNAGVAEIHVRISSPAMIFPCYYGVDTPNKDNLAASRFSHDELKKYLGATSLHFLSIGGLYKAIRQLSDNDGFCDACFTGSYPAGIPS